MLGSTKRQPRPGNPLPGLAILGATEWVAPRPCCGEWLRCRLGGEGDHISAPAGKKNTPYVLLQKSYFQRVKRMVLP